MAKVKYLIKLLPLQKRQNQNKTKNQPETEAVCVFSTKYFLFIMGSSCDSI